MPISERHARAARTLGVADADVVKVEETDEGLAVQLNNGSVVLLREDGHYRLTDIDNEQKRLPLWEGSSDEEVEASEDSDFSSDEQEDEEPEQISEVPDGAADKVLAWVDDNPENARAALFVEHGRDKPRVVLIKQLERIIGQ